LQRHSARVRPRGFDRGNPHGILFPPGCSKAPVAAASARVDGARPLLLSLHNALIALLVVAPAFGVNGQSE
jgi:hypothetical protein